MRRAPPAAAHTTERHAARPRSKTTRVTVRKRAPIHRRRHSLGVAGRVPHRHPGPVSRSPKSDQTRVYVDLPCHLIHGQKLPGIPSSVLDATGYTWEIAPGAHDCCGSGGSYNMQKPENARDILERKSAFLNDVAGEQVMVATSNHVCMMQWNSARDLVKRPFTIRHVIQLLDPENDR